MDIKPAAKPIPKPAIEKRVVPKRVWKADELRHNLMPTLQNMWQLDESIPFRQPVDPVALNIPVSVSLYVAYVALISAHPFFFLCPQQFELINITINW